MPWPLPLFATLRRRPATHRTRTVYTAKTVLSLKDQENVIFTPHNAFNTQESVERKARLSAESIVKFLASARFPLPVPYQ